VQLRLLALLALLAQKVRYNRVQVDSLVAGFVDVIEGMQV